MASYQIKQRDPLLDTKMQAALERRGKELLGVAMVGLGILVFMMLASYAPDDPSWLTATDKPVNNWLGRIGAAFASPIYVIAGWGSWGVAIVLAVWGVRFATHRGEDRAIGRLVFAPIFIALLSVYFSTLVPASGWTHDFGLGGMFGDTVLGAVLNIVPVGTVFGIKLMSALMGAATVASGLFVLGFTKAELKKIGRFLLVGLILCYTFILKLLGKTANLTKRTAVGTAQAAMALKEKNAQARELRQTRESALADLAAQNAGTMTAAAPANTPRVLRAKPSMKAAQALPEPDLPANAAAPATKTGLFSRMPSLIKRQADPVPELVEPEPLEFVPTEGGGEERIKAKIADVIKSRVRQTPVLEIGRPEPMVTRRNGPQPMVLDTQPPLTAPAPEPETDLLAAAPGAQPDQAQPFTTSQPIPVAKPAKAVVQHPPAKTVKPSRQARAEAQPKLQFEERHADYEKPPLSLLTNPVEIQRLQMSDEALEENARMLETVLDDYGVKGEIISVRPGPVVTMYELEPAPGLKASRVIGLADDIARSMSALSARVSTVPGRSVIGIELPNDTREKVVLREILSARDFGDSTMRLPLALGKDIGGDPVVTNLAKMPHLLIAGTTGSGKSVAINTMILSLLYKLTPEECRLIMIDPKMLELSVYDGIPHLLSPVVTDPKKAVVALKWVVGEMEERYRKMSKMGVRNIEGYNGRVRDALAKNEMFSRTVQTGFDDETGDPVFETEEFAPEILPFIVVIVDEMADLMMVAGKEIEACIQRLAQMARASGIHLIMATQRPSVDVITGTIKANFPTRISFQVTSKIDSRTILGEQGAEQLLGMGDMLYMAGGAKITRVHGPFVSDEEVEEIVNHLKSFGPPEYIGGVVDGPDTDKENDIDLVLGLGGNTNSADALYDQAVAIVLRDRKCSTSYIQRKLAIGYNKAARLVEQMEDEGLISAANHVGKRDILVPEQQ